MDMLDEIMLARLQLLELPDPAGELVPLEPSATRWHTDMPVRYVYAFVPETRPFAKKVKADDLTDTLDRQAQEGTVGDLRALPLWLQLMASKSPNELADQVARVAIPAYGAEVLPELWPHLAPDNRYYVAAAAIDPNATLARLVEKSTGKRADKGPAPVVKAFEQLLAKSEKSKTPIGPESLPLLRQGLKFTTDAAQRKKIAELIAAMGPAAAAAIPDMIDSFEKARLTRDYQLIRPLAALGKEHPEVSAALTRALADRDPTVRLMAAFNLGQMGNNALGALAELEQLSENDPDPKVRDQAGKTLNKLRLKQMALAAGTITPE